MTEESITGARIEMQQDSVLHVQSICCKENHVMKNNVFCAAQTFLEHVRLYAKIDFCFVLGNYGKTFMLNEEFFFTKMILISSYLGLL